MRMSESLQKAKQKQEEPPAAPPIARCAPCPCGSGNKYKRCCGKASAGKFTPPAAPNPSSRAPGVAA
jgi:hypothetical protein